MEATLKVTIITLLLAAFSASAATLYVSQASPNPMPPYINWDTAAMTIQDAVDAATSGDTVMVADGVYPGSVTATNPLTLLSVNGPQFTTIDGGGTVQCISLTDGDSLTGFTLRNGNGGGVSCDSTNAFVTNCVLVGNSARVGGGTYGCTLYNCTLTGNAALADEYGGGEGGGALFSTLYGCTLTGNSAFYGGGADSSTLYGCTLTGNSAFPDQHGFPGQGGGANDCTLNNCTLSGNSVVGGWGGGAWGCTLNNCTLSGNAAVADEYGGGYGGGADSSDLYNCIAYFNTATYEANYSSSTLNYCCTTPLPAHGVGNIGLDPQLASASHLSAVSPCRGAGSAAYATGTDIDGEAWANPPAIGCDEYHAGDVTGPLAVDLAADRPTVVVGYPVGVTALIEGRTTASVWDFGDGVVVSNRPCARHAWAAAGDYAVVLRAYNESLPGGVSATTTVHVIEEVHYVSADSASPQSPYTSWNTAAVNIQEAVDAAVLPGALVLVSNGVYAGGVTVTNSLILRGLSGTQFTVIIGGGTAPCVSLANGASLSGFTLTNGYGGVWCDASGVVSNCMISGNSNDGADGGTLYNCALTHNSGAGAYDCTLYNCTLTGNADTGVSQAQLYNCIVYYNGASSAGNYDSSSTLSYCCTTPLETNGVGNIDLDPQLASASHLSAASPCRGAGSAAYAAGTDIDGEAWANPPAIGCDEYHAGAVTGLLVVNWSADYRSVKPGYPVALTALIEGRTTRSVWEFRDGVTVTNEPYTTHAWQAPGDYVVRLWAFNGSYPSGVCATGLIRVAAQPVLYVSGASTNPQAPYTSWTTAATNIQLAMSVAGPGAEIVVSNGLYPGTLNVTKSVAIVSVNGPQFTIIDGGGTRRCAYLAADGASLDGFTLTNGYIHFTNNLSSGAGAWCATNAFLTNCVIVGNHAWGGWVSIPGRYPFFSGGNGGGVFGGMLYNCLLTRNSAHAGGGAANCTLYNCTLTGNVCQDSSLYGGGVWYHAYGRGGGAAGGALYNCIAYFNTATNGANYDTSFVLNYCCTTPLSTNGVSNITNAPLFVDTNGWSDLHLQTNSPGINAGNNAYVTTATDLDGNPRIAGGTVDMGAYEFQSVVSGGQFGSAAYSALTGFSFTFSGATIGQPYRIQTSSSLAAGSWSDLTNFTYTGPIAIADPSAVAGPKKFYRAVWWP